MANTNVSLEGEIWKDVVDYEGFYQVSSLGRIKSLAKGTRQTDIVLKNSVHKKTGYVTVELCKLGINNKRCTIHRLVALAFIPNPEDKVQVNHINGNKVDNRLENLEWSTRSENRQHAYDTGLQTANGEKNSQSKLTEREVLAVRRLLEINKLRTSEIARIFDITPATICDIKARRSWAHI